MQKPVSPADQAETPPVTGHLPDPRMVRKLAPEAHARSESNTEAKNSHVHQALAPVPSDRDRQP